jgi:hypothetical protein
MRRDRTLVERFTSSALVLRQLLLIRHLRRIRRTGQAALALLNLRRSALALLALNLFWARLPVAGVVGLVDHIAVAATRAAALIGLVRVDIRLTTLALSPVAPG